MIYQWNVYVDNKKLGVVYQKLESDALAEACFMWPEEINQANDFRLERSPLV